MRLQISFVMVPQRERGMVELIKCRTGHFGQFEVSVRLANRVCRQFMVRKANCHPSLLNVRKMIL